MTTSTTSDDGSHPNTHPEFLDITETAGQPMSADQVRRLYHRYYWAGQYCEGKDVLEVACGSAAGLAYLQFVGARVTGTDLSASVIAGPKKYFGDRLALRVMDAQNMDLDDKSIDIVIIFEALYYLPEADRFVAECKRVLRTGGKVLICNVNKDVFDFNRSPYSTEYHGVAELRSLFHAHGFETRFWGAFSRSGVSLKQRLLRPLKKLAIMMNIMPKTMYGKRFLKRLVFGELIPMPTEIRPGLTIDEPMYELTPDKPSVDYTVIYCEASL